MAAARRRRESGLGSRLSLVRSLGRGQKGACDASHAIEMSK